MSITSLWQARDNSTDVTQSLIIPWASNSLGLEIMELSILPQLNKDSVLPLPIMGVKECVSVTLMMTSNEARWTCKVGY